MINPTTKIIINNDVDIIVARMQARKFAKEMGFSTTDQARISLAVGELARVLAEELGTYGEIVISGTNSPGNYGIQVTGLNTQQPERVSAVGNQAVNLSGQSKSFRGVLSLMDEYLVENVGEGGKRVTLMKWLR